MKKKKRIKKKVIILLALFIILVVGTILFIILNDKKLKVDIINNQNVNIFDEVYNVDYIKNVENGEIISQKELIDTSSTGVKKFKIIIKDNHNKESEYEINLNVVDTENPIISFKNELTTEEGKKIDLLANVSATDNSKEDITVNVEGSYDFNKAGEYILYYVAKDSSNNETKEEFKLIVKEKKEVQPSQNNANNTPTTNNKEFTTSKGFKGVIKDGITYIDGILIANKTYSLPSTYNPGKLTSETQNAANQMIAAAKQEGMSLYVASGFRSYDTQKNMWTRRKNQYGKEFADAGTARPGHSEHQTGLGFDMCGEGNGCISEEYHNSKGAKWMAANAYKFGLILRYPNNKTNETGYIYESWHFRYVGKELASKLYNNGDWITLESYFGISSEYSD